jgi:hypothetical protein
MLNLYLFDMDSVLLYPGSYRGAFQETTNFFAQQMGLGDLAPTDDEIEAIEAMGITSEWDSAPISIADIILNGERPQYVELAKRVHDFWRKGEEYPAEAAHRLILEISNSPLANSEQLRNILLHSRDIHKSPVMYVFQQFILGDAFEATYGLPRTFESHSMLLTRDRKALDRPVPPNSAIYTARPSKPPREIGHRMGYAPEAEIGAELVGLAHLPIIAVGSFEWLVQELGNGVRAEELVKPSPIHGLAAIGAAAGYSESASLIAAEAASRGEWLSPLRELREQSGKVTVFEDSATSIAGVREAVRMLGPNWSYAGIGIAPGGPKVEVLAKVSDRVYASINDALDGELNG